MDLNGRSGAAASRTPASLAFDSLLEQIDKATSCRQCGNDLGKSPSDDFCSERCQTIWHASQVGAQGDLPVGGVLDGLTELMEALAQFQRETRGSTTVTVQPSSSDVPSKRRWRCIMRALKVAGVWIGLFVLTGIMLFEVLDLDQSSNHAAGGGIVLVALVVAGVLGVYLTRRIPKEKPPAG